MNGVGVAVVRSLRQAALAPASVGVLDLSASEALTCKNIMCANFPDGVCVCRLAKFLYDQPLEHVHTLDLSRNNIETVPDTVFSSLPALRYVIRVFSFIRVLHHVFNMCVQFFFGEWQVVTCVLKVERSYCSYLKLTMNLNFKPCMDCSQSHFSCVARFTLMRRFAARQVAFLKQASG
jgi:hypothetical protein